MSLSMGWGTRWLAPNLSPNYQAWAMGDFLQAQRLALQRGADSILCSGLGAPLARAAGGLESESY